MNIGYISSGKLKTGGYLYEISFAEFLCKAFKPGAAKPVVKRQWKYFKGYKNLSLLLWGLKKAIFQVNIVTSRLAFPAIIRNLYSKRKVLLVFHNYDPDFIKSWYLRLYYFVLFMLLKNLRLPRVAIVTVAPYWVNFFELIVKRNIPVFHFPNLFDVAEYNCFKTESKESRINLGQFSGKNHPAVFKLAQKLKTAGYQCYFSTLDQAEVQLHQDYNVIFENYESYLKSMAESIYTVAYIGIKEGWNRLVHESILVGTPVIGVGKGGLGDLLNESGSMVANSVDEIYNAIITKQTGQVNQDFIERYDIGESEGWIRPVVEFCLKK